MTARGPKSFSSQGPGPLHSPLRVHIGPIDISVTLFAWSASVAAHGVLLTASYFIPWAPAAHSKPDILFAKGERPIRVMILTDPFPPPGEEECDEKKDPPEVEETQRATELVFAPVVVQPIIESKEPLPDDDQRCPSPTADSSPQLAAEDQTDVPTDPITDETITNALEATTELPPSELDDEAHSGEVAHTSEPASAATPAPETTEVASASEVAKEPQEPSHSVRTSARSLQKRDPDPDLAIEAKAGVRTGVEVLDLPRPRYPLVSRRRGEEGVVLLRVEVLANGRAGAIDILRDPGFPRLTEAALQVVRKARFRPATQAGTPVKDTVQIPFRFILE